MRNSSVRRIALAASALTSVWAVPALAQSSDNTGTGNDIVVTARRVEEKLQDVPISITVYNQEQLSNRNIVNSTDLAAYTPSLSVNGKYGPDKSSFAIRGFQQDLNTLPTVGVYFADVVAPRLTSNITSGNGAGVGAMWDLQNVQVLKGPQGTLFGRNTTGGAILIVPQKPTDKLEGYGEASVGNYSMWRGQVVLNVPISDTIRMRVGIDRMKRDGWIHNRSGIGPADFNNVNYVAARFSLVADLTPTLENYTIVTYAKSDTHGKLDKLAYCQSGAVTGAALLTRTSLCNQVASEAADGYGYFDAENSDPNPFVKSSQWQVINTTTWKASDTITLKNIASYGEAKERYSFTLNGDNTPFTFVITNPGPDRPEGNQWTLTEEMQLQGRSSNDRLIWQVGGYLERSGPKGGMLGQAQWTSTFGNCTDVYALKCSLASFGAMGVAHNVYYYHNYGLYAQATYKFTDRFAITAGIRNTWDWVKEDSDNIKVVTSPTGPVSFTCSRATTPSPNPGSALLTDLACGIGRTFSTKSSKPTWTIDLEYKPTTNILAYAKYSRGYRAGGVNEANLGAETWNPEYVDDYELGLKTSFNGANIQGTFDIDGFWNEFKDQQASVFIPQCVISAANPACTRPAFTGINGIQNVGKSRLRGVEVESSLKYGNFRLDVGYAYLEAVVTGGSVPFCDPSAFLCSGASFLLPGSVLPYAPKNRITLTGTYTLPLDASLGKLSIGATFTHTDKAYSGHANDAFFAAGVIPFNASINPATDLLTLNLNWNNIGGKPIDLALFATNVTDQHYYVASGNALATTGGESIVLGEPRMFGMRVKVHFGS